MNLLKIRQDIDSLDCEILAALAARFDLCKSIVEYKEDTEDPNRESALQELWVKKAQSLGLSESFALEVLNLVLAESKSIQRKK